MFTLFDLIQWVAAFAFTCVFASTGQVVFGWPGTIGGAVIGFVVGILIGRVPWVISCWLLRRHLKRSTTDELKIELEGQYYISHLLIAELVVRGEPVEQFWPYILSLVQSESSDKRRFGWQNLNVWFPRLAKQVQGFDPNAPTETCREKLKAIEKAAPDAGPLLSEGAASDSR